MPFVLSIELGRIGPIRTREGTTSDLSDTVPYTRGCAFYSVTNVQSQALVTSLSVLHDTDIFQSSLLNNQLPH